MATPKEILKQISEVIPVTWDRYAPSEKQFIVFGWIARSDLQRDFLIIWFNEGDELDKVGFATSSAKYSAKVSELFNSEHTDCIKVENIPG